MVYPAEQTYRLLDDIHRIPIATYTQAMRVAIKYSMDDIQNAIVHAIKFDLSGPRSSKAQAIARLTFMTEFPDHFSGYFARELFTEVCSIDYHPTGLDLRPLMAYPALVALMMQYREGLSSKEERYTHYWLNEKIESLGFKS